MYLTNEQKEILNLVSKFGGLDIEQLKILMEPYEEKTITLLVNSLVKNHMLSIIDKNKHHYIVTFGNEKMLKLSTIACVWVMIEMTSSKDEFHESMNADPPAQFYFTSNRKEAYEILHIDSNNLYQLNAIQERYRARTKKKNKIFADNYIVLVVNDENNKELIRKISDYNLEFPFILALVFDSDAGKPRIKCLKSTPKKVQEEE